MPNIMITEDCPRKMKSASTANDALARWVWLLHYTCWKMYQNASGQSVLPSLQTATLPFQKELDTKEGIQINQESVEQSLLLPSLHEKKIKPP